MKPLPWAKSALALCIMGTLTACGGGGSSSAGEGDIADLPEPPPVVVVPPEESGIINTALPVVENFGEYTNFDQSDAIDFFSPNYKALATVDSSDYVDERPSFYYPTCCFFDQEDPNGEITVDHETRLGIVSDNGDPSLLISNARFTIGQTKSDMADPSKQDPKKDSTPGTDGGSGWGELDLSEPYRISFCVASASGSGSMTQIYVNNNTTGEANSIHGGGGSGSRIFNVETGSLIPGKRVEINVPGDITLQPGAAAVDVKTAVVGTEKSFLHVRVSAGGTAIIDDLLIEKQSENGQAALGECAVFKSATKPDVPEAPLVTSGDAQATVSWSSVLGATSYDLAWGTSNDVNAAMLIENITDTKYTLDSLTNGTEYFVFLRAKNSKGTSDWTEAVSANPVMPLGCTVTKPADIGTATAWSVWDGCVSPDTSGALVLNAATSGELSYPGEADSKPEVRFKSNNDGTSKLDSTEVADARSKGDLSGIFIEEYPQHFTLIARMDVSKSSARGIEVETVFAAPSDSRVKMILRPDQGTPLEGGKGRIQLERFMNFGASSSSSDDTSQADMRMTLAESEEHGYHIYHFSYTVEDPTLVGENNVTARVYRDGVNISGDFNLGVSGDAIVGTGRSGGAGGNRLRIGEDSSSGHFAEVDWIVWSSDDLVAAMTPKELAGKLPEGIGELGSYAGVDSSALVDENFSGANLIEDSETEDTNFFSAAYKGLPGNAALPLYNVTSGSDRITVAGGNLVFGNARFSIGETKPGTATAALPAEPTADDYVINGALDLSKPYVITFDVLDNDNTSPDTGKCQVYVDNNTSSSGSSVHGGDSKIFESVSSVMADGAKPTGRVTITSAPGEDHVGTETSFVQLRCDSGTGSFPVTIDNFKISYQ